MIGEGGAFSARFVPCHDRAGRLAEQFVAERVQQAIRVECRLWNALAVDQAEATMKGRVARAGFFETSVKTQ